MYFCDGVAWLPSWSNLQLFPTAPPVPENSYPIWQMRSSEAPINDCVLRSSSGVRPECRGECCPPSGVLDEALPEGRPGWHETATRNPSIWKRPIPASLSDGRGAITSRDLLSSTPNVTPVDSPQSSAVLRRRSHERVSSEISNIFG